MTKKHMAALAAILLFAATGAEAQTGQEIQLGKWMIDVGTDVWGDPNGDNWLHKYTDILDFRTVKSETPHGRTPVNEAVVVRLDVGCTRRLRIVFVYHIPNLEVDWEKRKDSELDFYKVPIKVDGKKGETTLLTLAGETRFLYFWDFPEKITDVKESLEILFAWGKDGQRQSLTWSMDGLSEAFSEACGKELEAEEAGTQ